MRSISDSTIINYTNEHLYFLSLTLSISNIHNYVISANNTAHLDPVAMVFVCVYMWNICFHFSALHTLQSHTRTYRWNGEKINKYNKWLDRCSLLVNKQFHIFRRMEEKTEWNEEQKDKTKKWFQVNPYEKLEWQREDFEFSTQWAKKRFSNKKKKTFLLISSSSSLYFLFLMGENVLFTQFESVKLDVCVCVWTSVQYAFNFCFVQMGNAFFPNWISCEWIDRSAKILRK